MRCKNCGSQLSTNSSFCGVCGKMNDSKGKNAKNQIIILVSILVVVVIASAVVILMLLSRGNASGLPVDAELETMEKIPDDNEIVEPSLSEPPPSSKKLSVDSIDKIIRQSGASGTFSVAVKDLKDGQSYGTFNANVQMKASALINIPILFTIAEGLKTGVYSLSDMVYFQYSFDGRGTLKRHQDGQRFALSQLMNDMLQYSDNNATNSLISYLTLENINATCSRYGFSSVRLERPIVAVQTTKDNYISANDIVGMIEMLYTDKFPIGKSFLNNSFKIEDKISRNGIGKHIPASYSFLNHNGVTTDKYNEVAIVYGSDADYIIVALSNNGVQEKSAEAIAAVGQYVHQNIAY